VKAILACEPVFSEEVFAEAAPSDAAVSPSARVPDRFRQHGVKLALGEFLGLLGYRFPRHDL
jgi:hypothetical protein